MSLKVLIAIFVLFDACLIGINGQTSCASKPCVNGVCEIVSGVAKCRCRSGFIGDLCNVADPCLNRDCKNGTCYPILQPNATTASYYCQCYSGFSGASCETNILNVCASKPCLNNGRCIEDKKLPGGYYCLCPSEYTGKTCGTYLNPCEHHKCENDGICIPDASNKNYTCTCFSGFLGFYCEQEIDECASDPCKNGATCIDLVDGYICRCPPNYAGILCQNFVSPCASNPCKDIANTVCKESNNTYTCPCKEGFFGDNKCKPDPCRSNPCKTPGGCIPIDTDEIVCMGPGSVSISLPNYICKCQNGFASYYVKNKK